MAAHSTLPDLDQRLQQERAALVQTVGLLRQRVRRDLGGLSPLQQARRHPGAVIVAAGAAGFIAGRLVGGLLSLLR